MSWALRRKSLRTAQKRQSLLALPFLQLCFGFPPPTSEPADAGLRRCSRKMRRMRLLRQPMSEKRHHFCLAFPAAGSKLSCRPLPKNRTVVFRQPSSKVQLPSSGRETIGQKTFGRSGFCRRNNRTLDINYREFCLQLSTLFSAGTARSHRKKYDFSVKWVLGQIPNKPRRWENVPTEALLASL